MSATTMPSQSFLRSQRPWQKVSGTYGRTLVGARDACASKNITLVEFLHYIDTHCATPWTIICLRYASILVNLSIREQDLNEDKNIKTGLQLSSMFGTRRNVEYSTTKRYSGSPSRAGVVNEARAQIFYLTNKINFLRWSGLEGKDIVIARAKNF